MNSNNQKGYIFIDLLFSIINLISIFILICFSFKVTNCNIKSLIYISIIIFCLLSYNSIKSVKKELLK